MSDNQFLITVLLIVFCLGCDSAPPLAEMPVVDPAPIRKNLSNREPSGANGSSGIPANQSVAVKSDTAHVVGTFTFPLAGGYRPAKTQASPLIAELLAKARAAMARRDLLTANEMLRRHPPKDPAASDALELERVWLMSRLLAKFWSGVNEAAGSLAPGIKLVINNANATVTSVEGGEVSLKFTDGTVKRLSIARPTMPAVLAEALARRGLEDSGSVTNRMVVAFHLLDREGDRERALVLCQRLERAGLNIDLFLPELQVMQ